VIYPEANLNFRKQDQSGDDTGNSGVGVRTSCEYASDQCHVDTHFGGLSIIWSVRNNARLKKLENKKLTELLAAIGTDLRASQTETRESQINYNEALKCRTITKIATERFQLTDNNGKKVLPDRVLIGGAILSTKPVSEKSQSTQIEVSQVWKSMSMKPRISEADFNTVLAMTAGVPIQSISNDRTGHKKLLNYES